MTTKKAAVLWCVWAAVLIIAMANQLIIVHEQIHQRIFIAYGVNSSYEVKWFGFGGGQTVASGPLPTGDEGREMNTLHAINEIYTYPVMLIFSMMLAVVTISVVAVYFSACENHNEVRDTLGCAKHGDGFVRDCPDCMAKFDKAIREGKII